LLRQRTVHTSADNVQEGEHSSLRSINHTILEVGKILPTGATRVGHRGHAGTEGEAVGINAVIAIVGAASCAGIDMDVNVDQSRSDYQAGGVDDAAGLIVCKIGRDSRDLVVANCHIGNPVQMVLGIDDLSATHDQVVVLLGQKRSCKAEAHS
jgi:hypothetical protein